MRSTSTLQRVVPMTTLIGDRVVNAAGETLGRVEDFVVDLSSGTVEFVILSFGGFLGVGDRLFPVPLEALQPADHGFVLTIPQERLRNAPAFDRTGWPDVADRRWASAVHRYYGYRPYWESH